MADVSTTIAAGGLSAAITTLVVGVAAHFGAVIGADEAAALGTIIGSGLHYATRWLPPENPQQPGS